MPRESGGHDRKGRDSRSRDRRGGRTADRRRSRSHSRRRSRSRSRRRSSSRGRRDREKAQRSRSHERDARKSSQRHDRVGTATARRPDKAKGDREPSRDQNVPDEERFAEGPAARGISEESSSSSSEEAPRFSLRDRAAEFLTKYRKESNERLSRKKRLAVEDPACVGGDATVAMPTDPACGDWTDRQSCLPVPSNGTLSMLNGPLSNVLMAKPPPASDPTAGDGALPVRRVAPEVAQMLPAKCRSSIPGAAPSPEPSASNAAPTVSLAPGDAPAPGGESVEQRARRLALEARIRALAPTISKSVLASKAGPSPAMEIPDQRAKRKAAEATASRAAETPEQRAKRKAAEAAARAAETPEERTKRKNLEAAALVTETPEQRAKRKAAEDATTAARRAKRGEVEAKRLKKQKEDALLGSLYDTLPMPDPEKDAEAARKAELEAAAQAAKRPKLDYKEDRAKIIFLDIDGVVRPLYGNQFQISSIQMDGENVPLIADGGTEFMTTAMNSLRYILAQTNAGIVLSSEWRRFSTLRDGVVRTLQQHGLPAPFDDTPKHEREFGTGNILKSFAVRRAREIGEWLRQHPDTRQWVALDDIDLGMADDERQAGQPLLTPRFVLTDKSACLTTKDAKWAVSILSGNLNKVRAVGDLMA